MKKMFFSVLIVVLAFQGCTSKISKEVFKDAKPSYDEVSFADIDNIFVKNGSYPDVRDLRKIKANINEGLSKDNIRLLLGAPHFQEGFFKVREWDYLFNFIKEDKVLKCQYKIIFDENYTARSFFWKPKSCEEILEVDKIVPNVTLNVDNKFELSEEILFDFAKYEKEFITKQGKEKLIQIAKALKDENIIFLSIIGHADKIGSKKDNLLLSQNRAKTIKEFLINHGIKAQNIQVSAIGADEQVKFCHKNLSKKELIKCLEPNRRVLIYALSN